MTLTKDELEALEFLREVDGKPMDFFPTRAMIARRTLARAFLREHLPGDELPFTQEWLESVTEGLEATITRPYGTTRLNFSRGNYRDRILIPDGSTRGDVRRFLQWQGIELIRNSEKRDFMVGLTEEASRAE